MLRLRNLLSLLRSPTPLAAASLPPLLTLHRHLSTAAAPFAVNDYLVATCGLTRAQALKASKKLSHLRSPSNPDDVLAFLSSHSLSRANIAAVIAREPRLLCASVKNLSKRVVELRDFGLSSSQIARLIMLNHNCFRSRAIRRNLAFWLPVLGSFDKLLQILKLSHCLLSVDVEKTCKPNLSLLQQCGIDVSDFPTFMSRVLTRPHKIVQDAVTLLEKIGVPRSSRMFYYGLIAFAIPNQEKLAKKFGILEMYGWSQEDVLIAVRKMPGIVSVSDDRLRRNLEFLINDVGLETPFIAQRPVLIKYSLERRLLPRHCVVKILKAKRLLNTGLNFYYVASLNEKKFHDKFIHPYEERVPGLAATYASGFAGNVLD